MDATPDWKALVMQFSGQLSAFAIRLSAHAPRAAAACTMAAAAANVSRREDTAGQVLASVRQCFRVPLPANKQGVHPHLSLWPHLGWQGMQLAPH